MEITYEQFDAVDIRVGKIIAVDNFPEARKPAYKLTIDLGPEIGTKKSSAQLPQNYSKDDLLNTLVMCVVNFPPRQIGPYMSEVLTIGVSDGSGNCKLVRPDGDVPLGGKLY